MAWIKRNLFFVIGTVIAVGLLAAAGVYGYKNWQRNNAALDELNRTYATLQSLNSENPSPGNDKIDNIQAAREQEQRLRAWIQQADQYFQPIPPVPESANITDAQFAAARDHTLNQLQTEAGDASITLPPQYGFSFEAERTLVKFAPGGLPALAQELGEVKMICETLYAAKINSLDGIRRVQVSADDAGGPQSDYLSETAVTNNLAVFTPYEVTFRGFSQNLAGVLSRLASSPHGFIVKAINVQPASGVAAASSPFGSPAVSGFDQPSPSAPPAYSYYAQRPPVASSVPANTGGLKTVLNEQLLSITLDIEIVKPLPGN